MFQYWLINCRISTYQCKMLLTGETGSRERYIKTLATSCSFLYSLNLLPPKSLSIKKNKKASHPIKYCQNIRERRPRTYHLFTIALGVEHFHGGRGPLFSSDIYSLIWPPVFPPAKQRQGVELLDLTRALGSKCIIPWLQSSQNERAIHYVSLFSLFWPPWGIWSSQARDQV